MIRSPALVIFLLLATLGLAQEPAEWPAAERQRQLQSFDQVWETIREKHWDEQKVGAAWEKVREELRPKIEKAKSAAECRAIMNEMISRLGQSHFGILGSEEYDAMEAKPESGKEPARRGNGEPGFELRVVDGIPIVTRVEPDTPAAKLGITPGWILRAVRGEELAPKLKKLREAKDPPSEFELTRAVTQRLAGDAGTEVEALFEDGTGAQHKVHLRLIPPLGTPAIFGNLPAFHVRFDTRKLEGGIAYAALNCFFDPINVMPKLEKHVTENLDAAGFILDLRGNPGGIGFMAMGIGGWFVQQNDLKLGTMFTRDGNMKFVLHPRPKTFAGPLAILVDGNSASTSEILAGGLKDLKRARIFGTRTAGAALPSIIVRLPNGDGFQYAFANYISEGGQPLEGRGVEPDEEIRPDRKSLLAGKDPVLDAAIAWIQSQKKTGN